MLDIESVLIIIVRRAACGKNMYVRLLNAYLARDIFSSAQSLTCLDLFLCSIFRTWRWIVLHIHVDRDSVSAIFFAVLDRNVTQC
jgi:hypothetical protein